MCLNPYLLLLWPETSRLFIQKLKLVSMELNRAGTMIYKLEAELLQAQDT